MSSTVIQDITGHGSEGYSTKGLCTFGALGAKALGDEELRPEGMMLRKIHSTHLVHLTVMSVAFLSI